MSALIEAAHALWPLIAVIVAICLAVLAWTWATVPREPVVRKDAMDELRERKRAA